jgi:ADP-ribosylglycohydrolase
MDLPLFHPAATFTDDTVCTLAVADCLVTGGDFAQYLRGYVRSFPDRGYGQMFLEWAFADGAPAYGSWGNGAAMRVAPIAYAADTFDAAIDLARRSASVSHDHPEAIKGAQAVVTGVFMALSGESAPTIRHQIGDRFKYDLSPSVDAIRPTYSFDVSCQGTVPQAIICAFDAENFEDALRNAISLGGDADTLACIAGGLAEVLYGIPNHIAQEGKYRLLPELREVLQHFNNKFGRQRPISD